MAQVGCPFTDEELRRLYTEEKRTYWEIAVLATERVGRPRAFDNNTAQIWVTRAGLLNTKPVSKNPNTKCPVTGCKTKISPTIVMCYHHWDMIPLASQMTVWGLFCNEGRSEVFQEALEVVVEIVEAKLETVNNKRNQFADKPRGGYAQAGKEK